MYRHKRATCCHAANSLPGSIPSGPAALRPFRLSLRAATSRAETGRSTALREDDEGLCLGAMWWFLLMACWAQFTRTRSRAHLDVDIGSGLRGHRYRLHKVL